ncbi:hypothetical protein [Luteolibacter soli]|uniref:Uncharacterized protein n=1 Tax=Luteolibacter soli TaxID=3135280 RepID=A0ABU9AWV8_9BACT
MKTFIHIFPALLLAGILSGTVQPSLGADDPFVRGQANLTPQGDDIPRLISVCFETFSIEKSEAAALYQGQPDDPALYKELTARVTKNKAKQEGFAVLRARSGEKSVLKGTSEFIYPASYLPAPNPGEKQSPSASDTALTTTAKALPADFKTRDLGFTLEIEPTLAMDNRIIDLRIAPAFVSLADRSKWGATASATETPVFESQELRSAYTLRGGQPQLLSTLSRPPVSKVDADSANRVWFAFVTAKVVAVTPEK